MWACRQCTYANLDTYDECAMCDAPPRIRPYSSPKNPKATSVPWKVPVVSKKVKKPCSGTGPALKPNKHRIPCQVRGCQNRLSKRWRHGRADEAAACATEHCQTPDQRWICDDCWCPVHNAHTVNSPQSLTLAHLHSRRSGTLHARTCMYPEVTTHL